MIAIRLGSGETVVNPGLKGDRDRCLHLTALQGKVAPADQMAHRDGLTNPDKDTYGNAASFLKRTRLSVYRTAVTPSR
jgi:hypothetical protein